MCSLPFRCSALFLHSFFFSCETTLKSNKTNFTLEIGRPDTNKTFFLRAVSVWHEKITWKIPNDKTYWKAERQNLNRNKGKNRKAQNETTERNRRAQLGLSWISLILWSLSLSAFIQSRIAESELCVTQLDGWGLYEPVSLGVHLQWTKNRKKKENMREKRDTGRVSYKTFD